MVSTAHDQLLGGVGEEQPPPLALFQKLLYGLVEILALVLEEVHLVQTYGGSMLRCIAGVAQQARRQIAAVKVRKEGGSHDVTLYVTQVTKRD